MKLVAWILGKIFSVEILSRALKYNKKVISIEVLYSEDLLDMEASFYARERRDLQRIVR